VIPNVDVDVVFDLDLDLDKSKSKSRSKWSGTQGSPQCGPGAACGGFAGSAA
jgi:hypothetical protein